jgi:hypothetical protein
VASHTVGHDEHAGFLAREHGILVAIPHAPDVASRNAAPGDFCHAPIYPPIPLSDKPVAAFAAERRGERWWIVSVYRAQESADMPIPPEFLPADD